MRVAFLGAAFAAALLTPAAAQEPFDACNVFTQEDAEKALGAAATPEAAQAKGRRPRVVNQCAYSGVKDGAPVAASAQFRIGRNNEESQRAFDEARLQHQTKPMLLPGAEAFWAGKSGVLHLRKGKAWVTLSVGPAKAPDRKLEDARRLAEILAPKL